MPTRHVENHVEGRIDERSRDDSFHGISDAELLEQFTENHQSKAFASLVDRHSSMVLHTCQSVLHDPHEAEDAAQATFPVLALKARSIRRKTAVASWLFGTARRIASRAARSESRRKRRERIAAEHRAEALPDPSARVIPEVFEELDRLPDRLRAAVILCDLEGHSYASAAERLGCPERTVHSRLYRARKRLRDRLTRRGLAPSIAAVVVTELATGRAGAAASLEAESISRMAEHLSGGGSPSGVVPESVGRLIRGASRTMTASAIRAALVVSCVGGGLAITATATFSPAPPAAPVPVPPDIAIESDDQDDRPTGPGVALVPEPISGVVLEGHPRPARSLAFHPDGQSLASGDVGKLIKLWRVDPAEEAGEFRIETASPHASVMELDYFPDGRSLASTSDDGFIRIWDLDSGELSLELNTNFFVHDLSISPDSRTLAWGLTIPWVGFEPEEGWQAVVLWDVEAGKETGRLTGFDSGVKRVEFSPDGRRLATLTREGTLQIWGLESRRSEEIASFDDPVVAFHLRFSPDGQTLAVALGDGRFHGRFPSGARVPPSPRAQPGEIPEPGVIRLFDVETGAVRRELPGHDGNAQRLAFSPDGRTLASGGSDELIRLWEVASGAELAVLKGHRGNLSGLAFSVDGRTLASCGADKTVRLWDLGPLLDRQERPPGD